MTDGDRTAWIVDTLVDAFSDLMSANPAAFRTKFRKMAADPFAFYRGSACLFYADVAGREDPWADERTSRVWIQGDLHAENFGTYMDGHGVLIFDVNDFDEAYIGHFTWDVTRFAASLALLGWRKAISDDDISRLVRGYVGAYLDQVRRFTAAGDDRAFSLNLATTDGPVHQVLQLAEAHDFRDELLERVRRQPAAVRRQARSRASAERLGRRPVVGFRARSRGVGLRAVDDTTRRPARRRTHRGARSHASSARPRIQSARTAGCRRYTAHPMMMLVRTPPAPNWTHAMRPSRLCASTATSPV